MVKIIQTLMASNPTPPNSKRQRADNDDSQDMDTGRNRETRSDWPKFLVIQGTDERLRKLSPFAINARIRSLAGEAKSINRLRSGDILVEVTKESHSRLLLGTTQFVNAPVKVEPHRTLNSSKGVIRCRDLKECSEDEIVTGMADQKVTMAKKMTTRREGKVLPTATVILTFSTPKPPKEVKVGYLNVSVDPYIPNPLRCFRCQQYGHVTKNCTKDALCPKCSQPGHEEAACKEAQYCINCKGPHPVYDKNCPKWIEEKEVQTIKTTRNVTYREAKEIVSARRPKEHTYAQAVSSPPVMTSIATQTDLTWPSNQSAPQQVVVSTRSGSASVSSQTVKHAAAAKKPATPAPPSKPSAQSGRSRPIILNRKPGQPKKKSYGDRLRKGSVNPAQQYNKYGALDDEEEEIEIDSPPPSPKSGSKGGGGFWEARDGSSSESEPAPTQGSSRGGSRRSHSAEDFRKVEHKTK